MDELTLKYREWILSQEIPDATITETDEHIRINSDFASCEVNFYDLETWVVELRITKKKTEEPVFFLHFEMNDLDYAKELFLEMLESYAELRKTKSIQVLLSCTSALTTGLMAEKLNDAAKLTSTDIHFDAVPFPELFEKANSYDLILIAPQIAYEKSRIESVIKDKPVMNISPRLFATYDAPAILEEVRSELRNIEQAKPQKAPCKTLSIEDNSFCVLVIALIMHSKNDFRMLCRKYRGGQIVEERTYMHRRVNFLKDITNIVDTRLAKQRDFNAIGISTPGEVHDGWLFLRSVFNSDINVVDYLEKRYQMPVVLKNNSQTAVMGFHARHQHYQNAAYISHSLGARFGGAGIIANGRLLEGAHNISGEIKYILRRVYGLTISESHNVSPEEMVDTVDFYVRCLIGIVDPEIIVIRNEMLADVGALRESLIRSVPERNMPKLRKISEHDALEYMLLGIMFLCLDRLNQPQ